MDGSYREKLVSGDLYSINVYEGNVYFVKGGGPGDGGHGPIYRVDSNGNRKVKLVWDNWVRSINIVEDWIWFTRGKYEVGENASLDLYKIKTDGTHKQKVK